MALLKHCLGKLVKSNHATNYLSRSCQHLFPARGRFLENCRRQYHGVTSRQISVVGFGKGNDGGGSRREKDDGKGNQQMSYPSILFVPAVLKGFFSEEAAEEASPEQDLINHIKRSILLMQNGEGKKAERLLHIALKMAQDLKHEKGITYIYDTMANLAFENGEHAKAQKLFVEVLKRLIGNGLPHDDIIVINISLKIADTFFALGDDKKSDEGFLFCINSLKKKIADGASNEDILVLYSQALDRYSLFLVQVNRTSEAVEHIETALQVSESVFGDLNNKVGAILLSDMGVIKTANGDKEGAADCFEKALKIAKQEEIDTGIAFIMVNRGLALKEAGLTADAKHWCEMGFKHALKEKNDSLLKAAEKCLNFKNENKREGRTAV